MADVSIGSMFGGYRIDDLAAEGGMGRVYRATQMRLNRRVALKVIVPELAHDSDFRARFERESYLSASIDHPNVIPIYEAGEAEGRLFIAMRWVEGTDLRSEVEAEGPLPPERAVAIVEQVAAALDAAHSGGLVHRDVKPANVMLTSIGGVEHVYLTDFGLTKRTASDSALTRTGMFVGTPDYMPPEQVKGEPTDARVDVYALGCVLYNTLTGRLPYERANDLAKLYAQVHDPPPSAVEAVPETPRGLDDVIRRALAKSADERYPSAGDLGRAARASMTGNIPSLPERSLATGPAAPGSQDQAPPPTAETPLPTAATPVPTPAEAAPPRAPVAPPQPQPSPPAGPPASPGPPAPPDERPSGRGLTILLAAVLGVLLLGVVLALAGVFSGGDDGGSDGSAEGGSKAQPAQEPKAVATIKAGDGPDGISVDGNAVWVSNSRGNVIRRIDAKTNKQAGTPIQVGANPDEVEAADGVVWVANTDDGTVSKVEVDAGGATPQTIPVGDGPEGLSLGKRFVWVANGDSNTVTRIDRGTDAVFGDPIPVGNKPIGIFAGPDTVWVTNSFGGSVTRIDAATGEVIGTTPRVGRNIRSVIGAFGFIWVSSADDDTITRLDPKTGKIVGDPIDVGVKPKEMAQANGFLWVVNEGAKTVNQIDPKKAEVTSNPPIRVGKTPVGLAAGAGALWATNNGSNNVTRIRP